MTFHRFRSLPLALLAGASLLGGCVEDETVVLAEPGPGGDLFARFVSLGNSITAGFQSAGINDSTQAEAFPVLVANQAGARFNVPDLAFPGCPPPLADPFSGQRISPVPCALRSTPEPGPIQNLAVPSAKIADAFNNLIPESSANALTTFILGGRTQVQAMHDANPTLVSAFLGNNDALGAALSGDVSQLTPLPEFQGSVATLVGEIEASTAEEAVLIGAVDPRFAPALQPGAYFFAVASATGGKFLGKTVSPTCAPGAPGAGNLVSFMIFTTQIPTISCADDAPFVLNRAEQAVVSARVRDFNLKIAEAAQAAGFLFMNPNAALLPFLQETNAQGAFNRIRKCQLLPGATTPQEFQRAILLSCPVTGTTGAPNFFGSLISFDGVHPAREGHIVLANALITTLNQARTLAIPTIPLPAIQ